MTQLEDFHAYLIAAQSVVNSLAVYSHPDVLKQVRGLRRRMIALEYRLEEINGGLPEGGYDLDLFNALRDSAAEWKARQKGLLVCRSFDT